MLPRPGDVFPLPVTTPLAIAKFAACTALGSGVHLGKLTLGATKGALQAFKRWGRRAEHKAAEHGESAVVGAAGAGGSTASAAGR